MRGVRRDTLARESDKADMIEKEENGVRNKQSDGAGMCGEATERERCAERQPSERERERATKWILGCRVLCGDGEGRGRDAMRNLGFNEESTHRDKKRKKRINA
jgi:hypothetical protein